MLRHGLARGLRQRRAPGLVGLRCMSTQDQHLLEQAAAAGASQPDAVSTTAIAPLQVCMEGLDAIHATTGLPWWATISLLAVGIRLTMLPVAIKGIKAGATVALFPAARAAAQRETDEKMGAITRQTRGSEDKNGSSERKRQPAPLALVLSHLERLRKQRNLSHPGWMIGAPLLQFPIFVSGMTVARGLAVHQWPGLETGGIGWFTNLTLPALDYSAWAAPMGVLGLVLPAVIVLNTSASLDAALRIPVLEEEELRRLPKSALIWRHAVRYLRLVLDIGMVPLFLIALQVPQSALCYWVTSSGFTLGQGRLLRGSPALRRALGLELDDRARPDAAAQQVYPGGVTQALPARGTSTYQPPVYNESLASGDGQNIPTQLKKLLERAEPKDEHRLFNRAAELVVNKQHGAAAAVLQRLLDLVPDQPNAAFALGQVHAAKKDWDAAEHWYAKAAEWHKDPQQAARAWFGVGTSAHMQKQELRSLPAFEQAANLAQEPSLKARALVGIASVYQGFGDKANAIDALKRAAEFDPKVETQFLAPLLKTGQGKKHS